jgi:hypothetical protein
VAGISTIWREMLVLGIALLLSDEGFQKALRVQVGAFAGFYKGSGRRLIASRKAGFSGAVSDIALIVLTAIDRSQALSGTRDGGLTPDSVR